MCSSADTRAMVRPTTSRARSSNDLKRTQPWKARPFAPQSVTDHVELLAALLVFALEPGGESGMTVEAQEMQHHARLLRCERNKWQRHFGILAIARRIHG